METQQLWQSSTTGSQTVSVPVTTLLPATVNPPPVAPSQEVSLSRATVERIVTDFLERQQQQQQQQQQQKVTRKCYLVDGSSVHFSNTSSQILLLLFKTYTHEGLTNRRMSFEDFAACPFFERELEAARKRGAEWKRVAEERAKRKSVVNLPTGRLCRFCHQPLMQGISSPHTHTCFPGIHCPSRVFSLYKEQGMVEEMTWRDFQQTLFFEAERDR